MARIINTEAYSPDDVDLWTAEQVYNGLDCCVTAEVFDVIHPQLDNVTGAIYNFSRELQAPVLEMRLRGILVNQRRRAEVIDEYVELSERLESNLERIVLDGVGLASFSWRSNPDLHRLFYDHLGIPPIRKGGRPTVDRNALEKMEPYLIARPIVRHIQALRDLQKKLGFLRTGIDPDGRIRTSYNIAGTDTGRFSSSYSEFGTGTNLQNVEESLRSIFISDPGMKFAKFDAKSGESFVVGAIEWNLFNDPRYLEACESGDPHTSVARICWPNLPWTGVLKTDKDIAETPYYRHYTYRFMCKKLGHGSNYGGQPETLSQQSRLPVGVVRNFQPVYFRAFPAHRLWQEWVKDQIRQYGRLTTLTGRRRDFWGRRNDDATFRAAIAYDPQGSLADIVNTALLRIWRSRLCQVMMQDHDAITIQYPEELEDEIVPQVMKMLTVQIPLQGGRVLEIPYDAKVGWNKGDYKEIKDKNGNIIRIENPDGLKDYVPSDKRRRTPEVPILDRKFR